MKKLLYIIICLGSLSLTACSDFLEQDNRSNAVSDEFYNTQTGFSSLLNTVYSSLRSVYGGAPWVFSAGTDLFASGKQGVDAIGLYGSSYNSADGDVLNFYTECYKGIQLANSVICYGETTEDSSVRLQYIDEARFLRAYYYYLLVQHFGGVSLTTTMFTTAEMNHKRQSAELVYQFVIDEFSDLASDNSHLLERSDAVGENFGRVNKRAALHFLAKTYLTRGYETFADNDDFKNAAYYAELAIAGEEPTISFEDVFDIENEENDEIFWSVQYSSATLEDLSADGNMQQSVFGVYLGGAEEKNKYNAGYLAPTLHLHQLFSEGDNRYEGTFMLELHQYYYDYYTQPLTSPIKYYYAPYWMTDNDIAIWRNSSELHKDAVIIKMQEEGTDRFGDINTYKIKCTQDYGVACIKKFDDPSSAFSMTGSTHDIILARLGETYLVAAEAYVKMNQPDKAKEKIDLLRKRATKPGYDLSVSQQELIGEDGIDFILDERARELAGEYHRWMDLKRTGRLIKYVANGVYEGEACYAYNHDNIQVSDFLGTDGNYKILRPIPLDAINRNKESVEQNPGF